ncbi:MAG: proline--tRNA ligase [Caldisericales bacterium]|jgi:prolyl-tRNA synthetase|nr:proline--tRNA ligase [Caldisericia bacterium]NMD14357.1 proline--tRNA ligase [Caldisericales bacterium]
MKLSTYMAPTLREVPSEAEARSHQLMLRAGYIRKLAAGVYTLLPLGKRVLEKISAIVREEMDNIGCQEMLMPAILPAELWQETGRWDLYGGEMFRLKDRKGRDFCLGPTHEEIVTNHVRDEVKSYRQLPMMLYQIQTKYRDEIRPRFGVIRSREFLMKDMYSFDSTIENFEISYKKAFNAYCRILERCGVTYVPVEADTGAIGGSSSHEFVVQADNGECKYTLCPACGYAANVEAAKAGRRKDLPQESDEEMKLVDTPNAKTIEEVAKFLGKEPVRLVKSMIYKADDRFVMVCVRGDDEICEPKLKKAIGAKDVELASQEETEKITGTVVGFAGPVGFKGTIVADLELLDSKGTVCGGLSKDKHYIGVSHGRDWKHTAYADIRETKDGDPCPKCGVTMKISTGLEVGHTFNLGTKYSKVMNANFLDEDGTLKPFIMGCYGMGISRTVASIIEQHNDEDGIIWPVSVAPFHVALVPVNVKDEQVMAIANKLYDDLKKEGIQVVMDDRDAQAGVKFKDADLMGFPLRITIGKKAKDGIVEIKDRKTKQSIDKPAQETVAYVKEFLRENQ